MASASLFCANLSVMAIAITCKIVDLMGGWSGIKIYHIGLCTTQLDTVFVLFQGSRNAEKSVTFFNNQVRLNTKVTR